MKFQTIKEIKKEIEELESMDWINNDAVFCTLGRDKAKLQQAEAFEQRIKDKISNCNIAFEKTHDEKWLHIIIVLEQLKQEVKGE